MKVGIIGCGWVAEKHIRFIRNLDDVSLVGIADTDNARVEKFSKLYEVKAYNNLTTLLNSTRVDILHILTPPFSHKALALEAIERGVHVYIEKPIALNAKEVEEIYKAAKSRNVKICVGYNYLFDPIVIQAIEETQKPKFGNIVYVESYYGMNMRRYDRLKTTASNEIHWSYFLPGGFHQNYMTHPVYMLLRFIGKPLSIHTECMNTGALPQDLTDEIRVLVRGEKGMGLIAVSYSCEPYQHYLKVFGEKEMLKIDWRNITLLQFKNPKLPDSIKRVVYNNLSIASQLFSSEIRNVFNLIRKKTVPYHGMKNLIERFYDAIRGNSESPISDDLVRMTEEMCDEIYTNIGKRFLDFTPRHTVGETGRLKDTVLVTGASGFLGLSTVKQLLCAGYRVRAFVRKLSYIKELEKMGVEIVFGDIRHYDSFVEAAKGTSAIVHLAAAMRVPREEYEEITVGGVRNLIRIAEELKIPRIIYMSSMSVYDVVHCRRNQILNEECFLERRAKERGAYSLSKLEAEKVVLEELINKPTRWTILRPAMLYGKNTNPFIKPLGISVGSKLKIIFGLGKNRLRLIHVDDVAKAILLSIENERSQGKIYNLVHPDRISKKDYVKKYVVPIQGNSTYIYIPHFVLIIGLYLMENVFKIFRLRPLLTTYAYRASQKDIFFDCSKIKEDLGWVPTESLDRSLEKTFGVV